MEYKVGVIGLGYVGLPLAVTSGMKHETIGFDINRNRIDQLKAGIDITKEVETQELNETSLSFTAEAKDLANCNFYVITVPTPVDENNNPDLSPLKTATSMVGTLINPGDTIVYESTVFPGCTEEECVPILEKASGLTFNQDFYCGYSPERINPGDKDHRITDILKVTSGSNEITANLVDQFYQTIIKAGTYRASSIKVAEAAKVIENSQRDINIAFVNELALIFDKLDIDTSEVLEAAATKWNFLHFKPGLVGGHCIGVDPYYLTQKAESEGHHPQVILAGRQINDSMGSYVAQRVIKLLATKSKLANTNRILILGITFKENCPDTRNTRVIDIYNELNEYNLLVDVYDPNADAEQVFEEYGIRLVGDLNSDYDAVVHAVAHDEFNKLDWESLRNKVSVIFDVKSTLNKKLTDGRL